MMRYIFVFISSCAVAALITPCVRMLALKLRIIDIPSEPRKIHQKPVPLLGGMPIFVGFFLVLWYVVGFTDYFDNSRIQIKNLMGLFLGGLVLMIGGYLDDKYNFKPSRQIWFAIAAALIVLASGIGIREITNPFGGTISLVQWERVLFWWQGVGYRITLPADLFAFAWLMLLMYTTKFLDGLDGLVSGITVIGALIIFSLATFTKFFQPDVGLLAIIAAGAFFGFLFWNWHPAKIFLGTGGSLLAGFLLGVLAIISGGKIATTLLVLGIPILDVIWVIARRVFWEKKLPSIADGKHLHFRLLNAGFSHRGAVLFLWSLSAVFGIATLFLQSKYKVITLGLLAVFMIGLGVWVVWKYKKGMKSR